MRLHLDNRSGMALATAVLAIVLIGALIAGTFFATTQDYRASRNALGAQRAQTAAEYGPNLLIRDWNLAWNQTMRAGNSFKRVYTPATGVVDTVVLTRLRHNMFYATSTGRVGTLRDAESRRRTGTLIRLNVPTMPFPGAFTGNGTSTATGNFKASGNDSIPAGWTDCPPPGPQMPAVASDLATNVATTGGCNGQACLTGNATREDPRSYLVRAHRLRILGRSPPRPLHCDAGPASNTKGCDNLYGIEIRRVLCSTNAIESLSARCQRAVEARGPSRQSASTASTWSPGPLDPTGRGRTR